MIFSPIRAPVLFALLEQPEKSALTPNESDPQLLQLRSVIYFVPKVKKSLPYVKNMLP